MSCKLTIWLNLWLSVSVITHLSCWRMKESYFYATCFCCNWIYNWRTLLKCTTAADLDMPQEGCAHTFSPVVQHWATMTKNTDKVSQFWSMWNIWSTGKNATIARIQKGYLGDVIFHMMILLGHPQCVQQYPMAAGTEYGKKQLALLLTPIIISITIPLTICAENGVIQHH